jgi:hypothetical protein
MRSGLRPVFSLVGTSVTLREVNMPKTKKATSDGLEILHRRYYRGRPKRAADLQHARREHEVALKIHALRGQAEKRKHGSPSSFEHF